MSSRVVIKDNESSKTYSRMVKSIKDVAGKIDTTPNGLYDQNITIKSGDVTIKNDNLDLEFVIPFDDDAEANEAEIVVYNLTTKTINAIKEKAKITITAGYGKDTGVIFSGYVSKKVTKWEDCDKVTRIYAIDNNGQTDRDVVSVTFGAGTPASYILKKCAAFLGEPIAVFEVKRDHVYKDAVTVEGGIMENLKKYAQICGVVAYINKGKTYVCPLTHGKHKAFKLTSDTGLLSATPFEEETTAENYTDHIKGVDVDMLLQHRVQTGSILNIKTADIKGEYRVKEGSHTYDGSEFKTTVKAIAYSCLK